jgi:hypothetical protein
MVCNSCGAQNVSSATHCKSCGAPLRGNVAASAGTGPAPPNYLVQSILVTLCCCLPFGIPAIVFASRVDGCMRNGDLAGAQLASASAKKWCWIGFFSGVGVGVLVILFYVLMFFLAIGVAVQDQAH